MPREGLSKPADAVETPIPKSDAVWAKTQVNQCIGVSRGGRSTKIHAVVDALGNPIEVMLTTGNTSDITVAEKLLSRIYLEGTTVIADRAYGKWEFREYIANHDADFCIPPKSDNSDPWLVDWWLYKERHILFGNINIGLEECRATPGAILVDVREVDEFASGHIPNAVNEPLSTIKQTTLPKDKPLFIYYLGH